MTGSRGDVIRVGFVLLKLSISCISPVLGALLTGELDALIVEGGPPLFVLRNKSVDGDDNGSLYPLALSESALTFAGNIVTVQLNEPPANGTSAGRGTARRQLRKAEDTDIDETNQLVDVGTLLPGTNFLDAVVLDSAGPADKKFANTLGARNITSVVFLISFCGYRQSIDMDAFRSLWLNNASSSSRTMQNYWANCSQGQAQMRPENQMMFDVPLPCTGTFWNREFNFTNKCSNSELYAWMYMAEDHVQTQLKVDISSVKQRIAVLPREVSRACPWAGLASVGCSGTRCFTWINGALATDLSLYMHEMGHNMGLMHSGRAGSTYEYGDITCTMGSGETCFNSANLWRLGWANPVTGGDLNSTNFSPGVWTTFRLPFSTWALQSHVRIYPDWAPRPAITSNSLTVSPFPNYHIAVRTRERYDTVSSYWLPSPGRVTVHTSNLTQNHASYQRSRLEVLLGPNGVFRAPLPHGIVVHMDSINLSTGAVIRVCRASANVENFAEGSCGDGIDNDCDDLLVS